MVLRLRAVLDERVRWLTRTLIEMMILLPSQDALLNLSAFSGWCAVLPALSVLIESVTTVWSAQWSHHDQAQQPTSNSQEGKRIRVHNTIPNINLAAVANSSILYHGINIHESLNWGDRRIELHLPSPRSSNMIHARLAQSVERETLIQEWTSSQGCGFDPHVGLFLYKQASKRERERECVCVDVLFLVFWWLSVVEGGSGVWCVEVWVRVTVRPTIHYCYVDKKEWGKCTHLWIV